VGASAGQRREYLRVASRVQESPGILIDLRRPEVTQGLLGTWLRCRREAKYFLQGWNPLQINDAFQYGDMAHQVLDRAYRWHRKHGKVPSKQAVLKMVDHSFNLREDRLLQGTDSGKLLEILHQQHAAVRAILPEYIKFWKEDFDTHAYEWARPEKVFRLRFGRFVISGKMDGAVRSRDKLLWLFESKNYSRINEGEMIHTLWRDLQVNLYVWALRKITGEHPAGAVYNILRKTSLTYRKGDSPSEFEDRVREHVKADPKHYFKRMEITISHKDQKLFDDELTEHLELFWAWLKGGMKSPRFGMPCVQKWGMCRYLNLCYYGETRGYEKRKVLYPELVEE